MILLQAMCDECWVKDKGRSEIVTGRLGAPEAKPACILAKKQDLNAANTFTR